MNIWLWLYILVAFIFSLLLVREVYYNGILGRLYRFLGLKVPTKPPAINHDTQIWCQGCDNLRENIYMGWDGTQYRCCECRGISKDDILQKEFDRLKLKRKSNRGNYEELNRIHKEGDVLLEMNRRQAEEELHGTLVGYLMNCRCEPCVLAKNESDKQFEVASKNWSPPPPPRLSAPGRNPLDLSDLDYWFITKVQSGLNHDLSGSITLPSGRNIAASQFAAIKKVSNA